MPQISQLAATYASQIFWLIVTFGVLFVTVGRGMLPKVQANIDRRDRSIADDLAAAQAARDQADRTEAEWRDRDAASREAALARITSARADAAATSEATLKAAGAADAARVAEGEAAIAAAGARAGEEIEAAATELTQAIVARVAGIDVDAAAARAAVRQAAHGV